MTKTEAAEIVRWLTTKSPTTSDYGRKYSFEELNEACAIMCGPEQNRYDTYTQLRGDNMPSGQPTLDGGIKHDGSKRRVDLVPPSLTNAVAGILEFGAKKYGDNNWRKGLKWSRIYAALQRHLADFWEGNDIDDESKLPHLYHAACNIAFLIEFYNKRRDLDDRFKEPPSAFEKEVERVKGLFHE